jgi:putative endonuclease
MKTYYVYILASTSGVLYVGMTNDLERRLREHRTKRVPGFSAKYNCDRLVWYELFANVNEAIACEKRIKGWRREKKLALIAEKNPSMTDLSVTVERRSSTPRSLAALGMTVGRKCSAAMMTGARKCPAAML